MTKKAIKYYNHTICDVQIKTEKGRIINVKPNSGIDCLDYDGELFTHKKFSNMDGKWYKI